MIRVMIVEDDPMVAEFNRRYLEKVKGFQWAASAKSVDEAIGILEKQKIDLILLDIFMPGKLGLELLAFLREKEMETDVVIISAASDMEKIKKALRYGVVDYLIKPFEFDRFQKALSAYQDQTRLTQNQQVTQEELDDRILRKEEKSIPDVLPKGLTKDTLKQIWEAVQGRKEGLFSTDDIVQMVGISRVSVRKYLNFLKGIGILDVQVVYGTIGRPVYLHQFNPYKEYLIKNYL